MSSDLVFPKYDGLQQCTWKVGSGLTECPHKTFGGSSRSAGLSRPSVVHSALELVGETPLIRLDRIAKEYDLPCELWVKAEYFNPGGSVKDRIALRMVEAAEEEGRIRPGDTLIEPTSGNTGTGLCMAAAIKGYRMIITMPEKMSGEKVNMMKALGAEIIRTPNEAPWNTPESHIGVAIKLQKEIPRSHILDQYLNPHNPLAHYEGTATEILRQCNDKVDVMVLGAGTGGTITGVARKMKDALGDKCIVVGVDPVGSILAIPDSLNDAGRLEGYQVEGIGYDFIPTVLERSPSVIDTWMKIGDSDAFSMARKLIRAEGLFVGGSSGTCVAGAIQYILSQKREDMAGKRVVALCPDSSRNYMSKFIDDGWMMAHGFVSPTDLTNYAQYLSKPWGRTLLSESGVPVTAVCSVKPGMTAIDAVRAIATAGKEGMSAQVALISGSGATPEMVTVNGLYPRIATADDQDALTVEKCKHKPSPLTVSSVSPLAELATKLDTQEYVLVVGDAGEVRGAIGKCDLLSQISKVVPMTNGKH